MDESPPKAPAPGDGNPIAASAAAAVKTTEPISTAAIKATPAVTAAVVAAKTAPAARAPAAVPVANSKFSIPYEKLTDIMMTKEPVEAFDKYVALGGLAGIVKGLDSNTESGITAASVASRQQAFGRNELPKEKPVTFWSLVVAAFSDHTILLLAFAACVAIIIGMTTKDPDTDEYHREQGWIEGFAIVVSILVVTGSTTINDYNKEQKFQKLTDEGAKVDIVVRRDGKDLTIDVSDLVVGDVCLLSSGLVLPCDGILIKGQSVVMDESAATGESDPKKKNPAAPFIMGETTVATGENAWMLVICVGENSFGGKLLAAAMGDGEGGRVPTPLQVKLDDMAEDIGKLGLAVALTLFLALSIIEIVQFATNDPDAAGVDFLNYFIISVSIVVVAVPEGLPLSVTIALAYSQSQMMADNNQVRRLAACETMGNATQICSDKTGTLTQNLMSVKQVYICGIHTLLTDAGATLVDAKLGDVSPAMVRLFSESISYNSSSGKVLANVDGKSKWQWRKDLGNKTENGMLDYVDRVMLTTFPDTSKTLPHQTLRAQTAGDAFLFPFTSDRKRMSTLIRDPETKLWTTQHVKGASEAVLELSNSFYNKDGVVEPMTAEVRAEINARITSFAKDANRTIGIAVRTGLSIVGGADGMPAVEPTEPLTWIGVTGIQDPLRAEVIPAVKMCLAAQVKVRMCTGDNLETAIAISKECGIYVEGRDLALTGQQFREIVYRKDSKEYEGELAKTLDTMTVMARSQPLDKQLLVLTLMTRGDVVAVTGDGTNDAPALKLANVGFVMKSGTDVAVKSADIVLLDDNFKSVQRAVVWGRTVNDNIRKFLQFQLSVNVVCVVLTFVGSLSAEGKFPLKAVQLLWVNLMMDTLAALSLSTEGPTEECLDRGPIQRKSPVVSRKMWRFIAAQSMYQLTVVLLLLHKGQDWFWVNPQKMEKKGVISYRLKFNTEHMTIVFNVFVLCTIFNEFNARLLYDEINIFRGWSRSPMFVIIIVVMVGFQIFAIEVAGEFMKTTSLTWKQWLVCAAFGSGSWPVGFISRFIPVTEPEYEKEFDPDDLDKDARKRFDQLNKDIKTYQEAKTMEQARTNWARSLTKVKSSVRVLGTIRRAKLQHSLKTSSAYGQYKDFKATHPSAYPEGGAPH